MPNAFNKKEFDDEQPDDLVARGRCLGCPGADDRYFLSADAGPWRSGWGRGRACGGGFTVQVIVAAAVGGLAVVVWNAYRQRQTEPPAARETAQHLDVGETVQVDAWDAQGLAQVKHRGANWTAVNTVPSKPSPGLHRIQAIQGNRLVLEKI